MAYFVNLFIILFGVSNFKADLANFFFVCLFSFKFQLTLCIGTFLDKNTEPAVQLKKDHCSLYTLCTKRSNHLEVFDTGMICLMIIYTRGFGNVLKINFAVCNARRRTTCLVLFTYHFKSNSPTVESKREKIKTRKLCGFFYKSSSL